MAWRVCGSGERCGVVLVDTFLCLRWLWIRGLSPWSFEGVMYSWFIIFRSEEVLAFDINIPCNWGCYPEVRSISILQYITRPPWVGMSRS